MDWRSLKEFSKVSRRYFKPATSIQPVSDEQLRTVLARIEGTINSHSLISVNGDINEFHTLTQKPFSSWRPRLNHSPGTFTEKDLNCRTKGMITQTVLNIFWKK